MKKKILSLCLVLALAATAVVGGTLAYFTDTEKATNVMTIGNVEINIEERTYDHDNSTWKEFENGSLTLYPVDTGNWDAMVATGQGWNKVVRTFNTSSSQDDAYIRTIIAIEHIDSDNQWKSAVYAGFGTGTCDYNVVPYEYTIDGVEYDVYVCTAADDKPIAYKAYLPSLQSVALYANVTQDEVKDASDLQILVLSQGIQAEGFKTASNTDAEAHDAAMAALGEINETNVNEWFNEAAGANVNEFAPAFNIQ